MGTGIWLLASRNANALFEGFIAGGALLALACSLGGFILGNVGRSDGDIQIGQFLATRPITSAQMAGTILKTAAKSVFLGWAIWALAFLVLYGILLALRINLRTPLPAPLGWWLLPVALLGAWTAAGILAPIALAGRQSLAAWLVFGSVVLFVGLLLFSKNVLSPQAQDYFAEGLAVFWGIAFVLWTIWAFAAARRRLLVGRPTVYVAAGVWSSLCILAAILWAPNSVERLTVYVCVAGILALAVAPLATAALALAWNRTR